MKKMKGVASALLFTVVALAEMQAYSAIAGEMMVMLNGGDRHPVSERGTIGNDTRGDNVHARTRFSVDNPSDPSVPGAFHSNSTQGILQSPRARFSGTSEFLLPAGMDVRQSTSAFGAASGVRLLSW